MLAFFHHWDLWLDFQINQIWVNPLADQIMATVSDFNFFKIPLALLVFILVVWGGFRERLFLVLMALCLLIGDAGIVNGLKHWIDRPRPLQAIEGERVVSRHEIHTAHLNPELGGRSFPSGHTCNNVTFAIVASSLYESCGWIFWLWAILVSYSRIYVGAHYPSDVLGSWILSLIYTTMLLRLIEALWRRFAPRFFPKLYKIRPQLIFKRKSPFQEY